MALDEPGTYSSKSSFAKEFKFKSFHFLGFSAERSGNTLHCYIQWESG
jgi:hypothetical protein